MRKTLETARSAVPGTSGASRRRLPLVMLAMPPGIPHQTIVEPGKSFFVLIVKVQRK